MNERFLEAEEKVTFFVWFIVFDVTYYNESAKWKLKIKFKNSER